MKCFLTLIRPSYIRNVKRGSNIVILVVSDVHLGYAKSNVDEFDGFLQNTIDRTDVDALVILGDFIDMWRRDISGLFLENHQILQSLLTLQKKKAVYYIVGNHDYHLLRLVDHKYPLEFKKNLTLKRNGVTYVFKHGYEFDDEQWLPVVELLCDNISDEVGQAWSEIWGRLTSAGETFESIKNFIEVLNTTQEKYVQNLLTPPNVRLSATFGEVEKKAAQSVQAGQLLVFGHTHKPFVSPTQSLVNTGSWVNDEETYNTYVELDGKNISLMRYQQGDITKEMTRIV